MRPSPQRSQALLLLLLINLMSLQHRTPVSVPPRRLLISVLIEERTRGIVREAAPANPTPLPTVGSIVISVFVGGGVSVFSVKLVYDRPGRRLEVGVRLRCGRRRGNKSG